MRSAWPARGNDAAATETPMSHEAAGTITRRQFMRRASLATAVVTAGFERAPAYAAGTSLHFLLWKNFAPPADPEILRQGTEWGKQHNVTVKIEQVPPNDIPARAAVAIETGQGPDIIQFFHNWQNQYAHDLVDVTDICADLESKYGGFIDYAKAHAMLDGRFTGVPHTIVPQLYVVRLSYLKAAGTPGWPKTWDELRREAKKW
jgi:multiple sugar transport system substrate-binding protein